MNIKRVEIDVKIKVKIIVCQCQFVYQGPVHPKIKNPKTDPKYGKDVASCYQCDYRTKVNSQTKDISGVTLITNPRSARCLI